MNIMKCPHCGQLVNIDSLGTKTGSFACPICGKYEYYALGMQPNHVTPNPLNTGFTTMERLTMVD